MEGSASGGKLLRWVVGSVPKEDQVPTHPIPSCITSVEGSNLCQELSLMTEKREKGISAHSSSTFALIPYPKGASPLNLFIESG